MSLIRERYSIFIFTFYSFDIDLKFWTYTLVQLNETERRKEIKIQQNKTRFTSEFEEDEAETK